MKEERKYRRYCLIGITMVATGMTSFSNHPYWGVAFSLTGACLILYKEYRYRKLRSNA